MEARRGSFLLVSMLAFSLTACGGTEQEDVPAPSEADLALDEEIRQAEASGEITVEEGEIAQTAQELRASCGERQFPFARCDFLQPTLTYGCKNRSTGKIVWVRRDICVPCRVEQGTYYSCGYQFG